METVRLNDVSEEVRAFLDRAFGTGGVLVADAAGRACGGVLPYFEVTDEQKRSAWQSLERLQEKVAASMQRQGVTEDDVDRVLQEDE
jgi:hypothetical protein